MEIKAAAASTTDDPLTELEVDRRQSGRVQTVFRVARVKTTSDEGLARVRNISDAGISLQLHMPVALGDVLVVELATDMALTGCVVWSCGPDCGVQLDREIDSAGLLTELASRTRNATGRPLRLPAATIALTRGENGTRRVEITDVSQRGMKLMHDGSFTEGLQVKITLPSGRERRGIVRWSRENLAGVLLLEPFSTEDLGSLRGL